MEAETIYTSLILNQLRARNAAEATYTGVFADYQALLRTNRELQVFLTKHCTVLDESMKKKMIASLILMQLYKSNSILLSILMFRFACSKYIMPLVWLLANPENCHKSRF